MEYIIEPGLEAKIELLKGRVDSTLVNSLEIQFTEFSKNKVCGTMPVNNKTRQPFGLLHGGASVALAESLASVGGWLNCDETKHAVVGIEINANHLKSKRDGIVSGIATPLHIGKKTQVWEIKIHDENDILISISRCTLAVVDL